MGAHTKYGYCKRCEKWVPRDDMGSINVDVYDENNNESRIRMRLCPECHQAEQVAMKKLEWENVLKMEHEIQMDPVLAESAGVRHDDSEGAMRRAGMLRDSVPAN